ncbi:hypothetical protein V2W45_1330015 [Cenococcum geophilum]
MHASNLRDGTKCTLLPEYSWGYNHLVRLIEFGDKKQLLASPYANDTGIDWDEQPLMRSSEDMPAFPCLKFMHESTDCCGVHAPFMLMEALKENNIIGATGNDPSKLSEEQRSALVKQIAEIHTESELNQINRLRCLLFDCLKSAISKYPIAEHPVRTAAPEMVEDLISERKQFPLAIKGIANKLSVYGFGPFFLQHGSLNRDRCYAAPWKAFASLPNFVFDVPRGTDAPSRYDENGNPADFKTIKQCARINEYIAAVKRAEEKKEVVPGNSSYCLSQALENTKCRFRLDLAYYPILVLIPGVLLPPFQLQTPPTFPIPDTYLMYK